MCRTVTIFSVHCDHRHTEVQKCNDMISSVGKKRQSNAFSKLFRSSDKSDNGDKICTKAQPPAEYTKAQVCPACASRGLTYEKIRRNRDDDQRRPNPRPFDQDQDEPSRSNPAANPSLKRSNAVRYSVGSRPQALQRSNTVQFEGEAPKLPNVRATAIFRDSKNPTTETVRRYLGDSGIAKESPQASDYQRPPIASSAGRRRRHSYHPQPSQSKPSGRSGDQLTDRPLPPLPLQPHRYGAVPSSRPTISSSGQHQSYHPDIQLSTTSPLDRIAQNSEWLMYNQPTPPPSRSSSQRFPQQTDELTPPRSSSSSQRFSLQPGYMTDRQPVPPRSYPQGPSRTPSHHRGQPTDRELNRMSREREGAESAWINAGRPPSQQRPVQRSSTRSLAGPRHHRSQKDGKYA